MTVSTAHQPTHREALWELDAAFDRGDLVTIFGRCTVEYSGRAASSLGLGRRLVILKPDGAALVHTDENQQPVNWQPPGSKHHAAVRDGHLRVRSVRSDPDETLDVRFESVAQLSAMAVSGRRDLSLTGSEAELRTVLLDRPDAIEAGFEPLATERPTDAGPIDLFGRDSEERPVVVELKRRRVGPSAVGQLQRYVAAIRREEGGAEVRGVLVAPSVTDRARRLLAEEGLEFVSVDPPDGSGTATAAAAEKTADSDVNTADSDEKTAEGDVNTAETAADNESDTEAERADEQSTAGSAVDASAEEHN